MLLDLKMSNISYTFDGSCTYNIYAYMLHSVCYWHFIHLLDPVFNIFLINKIIGISILFPFLISSHLLDLMTSTLEVMKKVLCLVR